ncbi:MAG: hypothetical protein ABIP41_05335 [Croceibacterium sp.]
MDEAVVKELAGSGSMAMSVQPLGDQIRPERAALAVAFQPQAKNLLNSLGFERIGL